MNENIKFKKEDFPKTMALIERRDEEYRKQMDKISKLYMAMNDLGFGLDSENPLNKIELYSKIERIGFYNNDNYGFTFTIHDIIKYDFNYINNSSFSILEFDEFKCIREKYQEEFEESYINAKETNNDLYKCALSKLLENHYTNPSDFFIREEYKALATYEKVKELKDKGILDEVVEQFKKESIEEIINRHIDNSGYYGKYWFELEFINGYGIYVTPHTSKDGRKFPLTTKYILDMCNFVKDAGKTYMNNNSRFEFFNCLLEDLSSMSYALKDLYTEFKNNPGFLSAPYSLNDFLTSNNKVDFFRNKRGLVKDKDIKSLSLISSSYLREATPKLTENSIDKFRLFLKDNESKVKEYEGVYDFEKIREGTVNLINECLQTSIIGYDKPNNNESEMINFDDIYTEEYFDRFLITDYIAMSIKYKEKINLNLSYNQIKNKHDELSSRSKIADLKRQEKLMKKAKKKIKLYEKIKIKDFIMLKSAESFHYEGEKQHNCVAHYYNDYLNGKCAIFSGDYMDNTFTLEIRLNEKNIPKIYQLKAKFNEQPPKELYEIINQQIEDSFGDVERIDIDEYGYYGLGW